MSKLKYLEKLLDGAEVEWMPLAKFCDLITTGKLNANAMEDGGIYPFFTCNEQPYKINTYAFDLEALLISGNGSQVGHLNYYKGKFNAYQRTYVLGKFKDSISVTYLFHYLKYTLRAYIAQNSRKGSVPYITMPMLENFQIPIPCPDDLKKSLEIQAEIVRILDAFTALTAELTAELTARKKQYNYYRDQLLTFAEGEVEWKTFGEVATIQRGASPRPIAQYITDDEDGIPWIKIGDTSSGSKYVQNTKQKITQKGAESSRVLKKGDFIISNSMSFGRPYILNIDGAIHDGWASVSNFNHALNPDFLYHYLSSNNVQNYWLSKINSGSVGNLNADIIKTLPIPIPYANDPKKSLSEQARIASILDKFDTLTNSIGEGLPHEIELRQKQYEYYRDLLLSFPKTEEVAA